ncbi:MAG: amino acid carrier protein [Cyclobacteriaceae bacterium]|nr:amino acid carrier protein [Cyclobacteriaceae bacterium]
MQLIQDILSLIDNNIGGAMWFAWLLLFTGVFFTIYLKFPQIRYFKHAFRVVTGKYDKKSDAGDTTHYQALATALSGTVGTGNIAGVAFAIFLGGPSALFWMLMTALVGMTTKFVEVTLSHKYREKTKDGTMAGGPMYYMKHADFSIFGQKLNLKWMAVVFAIATVFSSFGTGSLPQINSIANSMYTTFGLEHWITGAILAVFLALVIIGGIKRIVKVTQLLTPTMAIIYLFGALLVIAYNYENIIPAIVSIFAGAFSGTAAAGGFLGSAMIYAFNRGVNRGLFSNEAGQGSAPIAHAAAKAHEPVSEGMVAILEPFIDTVIICMLTGLVILTSGVWTEKHQNDFQFADLTVLDREYDENNEVDRSVLFEYLNHSVPVGTFTGDLAVENGKISSAVSLLHARSLAEDVEVFQGNKLFTGSLKVVNGNIQDPINEFHLTGKSLIHSAPLTTLAFTRSYAGEWGKYIVAIGLLLFAFSTAISWSYYGDRAMTFLFGSGSVIYFRIVYVIGFFVASFIDTTIIWIFSGITIALMTLPNLIGLLLLRKEVKSTITQYWVDFKNEHPNEKTPE